MQIEVNEKYRPIFEVLIEFLLNNPDISIEELKKRILSEHTADEGEIYEIIYYLVSKNCISIVETSRKFEKNKIRLIEKPEIKLVGEETNDEYPKIVISLPPYNIFGLETELRQLNFPINNLKDEFQKLFEKAYHSISICSPFLEYNGFNIYLPILLSKAKDGVDIKIIARQISKTEPDTRYDQIKKIQQIFYEKNVPISIRNYHFSNQRGIVSSTHAKMIICDYKYAYIGSGELRRNSFEKNFEVGVILEGKTAYQLGKIFDKLFSVSIDIGIKGEEI